MKKKLFIFFTILNLNAAIDYRIKMYTICSESHTVLRNNYFLPSIKDNFDIVLRTADQLCKTASYLEEGWNTFMVKKVEFIIDAIKENWNKIFVYSDVDIQFFKSFEGEIENLILNKDIVIQKNDHFGNYCAGFFICKGNDSTLKLWSEIKNKMLKNPNLDDQIPLNDLLKYNIFKVKHASLPNEFFQPGLDVLRRWQPSNEINVPKDIIMHHACYTVGLDNKIAQLEYVKSKVENKQ